MNKRDREQLRASIAKDLVQGQGEHSPTKELLKQYAPLEGIVTTPAPDISRRPGSAQPVENSLAPHATVAQKERSPWHGATVAPAATVAPSATVAGDATVAPPATVAPETTVARDATNKYDDDDLKRKSSSKGRKFATDGDPVENLENHSRAAEPRERQENADRHFALIRAAYERATGNRWRKSDSEAYNENGLQKMPAEKIISTLEAVARRDSRQDQQFQIFCPRNHNSPGSAQPRLAEEAAREDRPENPGYLGRPRKLFGDRFYRRRQVRVRPRRCPFDHDIFNELVT